MKYDKSVSLQLLGSESVAKVRWQADFGARLACATPTWARMAGAMKAGRLVMA
jgi:hypothetical protein